MSLRNSFLQKVFSTQRQEILTFKWNRGKEESDNGENHENLSYFVRNFLLFYIKFKILAQITVNLEDRISGMTSEERQWFQA